MFLYVFPLLLPLLLLCSLNLNSGYGHCDAQDRKQSCLHWSNQVHTWNCSEDISAEIHYWCGMVPARRSKAYPEPEQIPFVCVGTMKRWLLISVLRLYYWGEGKIIEEIWCNQQNILLFPFLLSHAGSCGSHCLPGAVQVRHCNLKITLVTRVLRYGRVLEQERKERKWWGSTIKFITLSYSS